MTDLSRFICSITAFMFLALFVSIPYLPANLILELYVFFTQKILVLEMITLIPLVIFFGVKDKEWSYALFLIIFMTGQIMFVHVYADNYTIATSKKIEKSQKTMVRYSQNWNKA